MGFVLLLYLRGVVSDPPQRAELECGEFVCVRDGKGEGEGEGEGGRKGGREERRREIHVYVYFK